MTNSTGIRLSSEDRARVQELAAREGRSAATMFGILIEEALAHREERDGT